MVLSYYRVNYIWWEDEKVILLSTEKMIILTDGKIPKLKFGHLMLKYALMNIDSYL